MQWEIYDQSFKVLERKQLLAWSKPFSHPISESTELSLDILSTVAVLIKEGGRIESPRKSLQTTNDSRLEFRLELGLAKTTSPEKRHLNWAPSKPASRPRKTLATKVPPFSRIRAQIVSAARTKWDWTYSSKSWRPVTGWKGNELS